MPENPKDGLTHFDAGGRPRMVDVSAKPQTMRTARASGFVRMSDAALDLVRERASKKGDPAAAAELAGVMGAKRTADLIPLCHPLSLSAVNVDASVDPGNGGVSITASVKTTGPTGVEMEALTAVTVACLTLYDMLKAVDKEMTIEDIALMEKTGGASGDYKRSAS